MENLVEPLLSGCPYSRFRPPTISFCEANLCSYVTQPANTISNLGFFVVAYWIFLTRKKRNFFLSMSFSAISLLIGIFSAAYHASFTFFMQFFDLASMFILASFLLSLNLYRMNFFSISISLLSTCLITLFCSLLLLNFKRYGIFIFSVILVIFLITELYLKNKEKVVYKNFLISISIFFIGFFFWCLDYFKILCNPNHHFIQGHGVWHILSAGSIYYLYLFYEQNLYENKDMSS